MFKQSLRFSVWFFISRLYVTEEHLLNYSGADSDFVLCEKTCRFVCKHQRYEADCCLLLQGDESPEALPKCWYQYTILRTSCASSSKSTEVVAKAPARNALIQHIDCSSTGGRGGGVCWCCYMWQRRLLGNGSQLTETWKKCVTLLYGSDQRIGAGGEGRCRRKERRRGVRQKERGRCVEPHPM